MAEEPQEPTHIPKKDVVAGSLSIVRLEAVVYAGQSHEQVLPNGTRRGFFIGDETGVDKGREISGIIIDNMNQGRKKAVWVSKDSLLFNDAKEHFEETG